MEGHSKPQQHIRYQLDQWSHNGRTTTDTKSKANIFFHHYAIVSKLHMTKEHHDVNRHLKKHRESYPSINMSELLSAI